MKPFDYAAPATLDEAVALFAEHGRRAKPLAGGTDILVQLREGLRQADLVVDMKRIPEFTEVRHSPAEGLTLGAAAPCWKIYEDEKIASVYHALADAARIVGGWQIQSRASVGGNLCNSSPAADTIPPLIAYQAVCRIASKGAVREASVEQFCTGPGRNILADGEVLVSLRLPPQPPNSGAAYQRFIPRNEMDIAVVGVASWLQLDPSGQTIQKARIALGAVAPTPLFAADASAFLAGKPATEDTFRQAGELAEKIADPIYDMRGTIEFRKNLVQVLTRRTLALALSRART